LKHLSFTVASPRLDAAVSGLFRISREKAAGHIKFGNVSLNYEACLKPDAQVKAGDIISLRGSGKARIKDFGALSRKGRLFINGEIWI
jgi:RNA-binding protein YlmH